MEHSSQKSLSETSRGLERHTRNANAEPGLNLRTGERQTPTDSHQPPILTFMIYLNIMQPHGTGWKGARAAEKKYYPVAVGWQEGGWRFFFEQAKRTLVAFHSASP
jgi:hypothetical protein